MDKQERLAREWAKKIKSVPVVNYGLQANAAAEHILATTEPEMPDLKRWDGVEMDGREWVVQAVSETGALQLIAADGSAYAHDFAEAVTPSGKRYELREITDNPDAPTHPATLTTEQDYDNAPRGTIVDIDGNVAVRSFTGWYRTGEKYPYTSRGMRYLGEGDVIRWGWGK